MMRRMPEPGPGIDRGSESYRDQPRRSASQMPEQAPLPLPLQDPAPLAPARRPLPTALLSPAFTLTTTVPFLPTLPLMLMGADPALPRLPLVMRIGYRYAASHWPLLVTITTLQSPS